MSETGVRVLVGSPIHQKPQILQEFLDSLLRLRRGGITLDFYFIDDNEDEASSALLRQFTGGGGEVFLQSSGFHDAYIRNDTTHFWNSELVWKVASFKNLMIRRAEAFGYDYLFLIDSDLILHPDTLLHLICTEKDIISEVFWTQWQPGTMLQPQVWLHDEYNQWEVLPGEKPSQEEINRRFYAFLAKLQQPGIYEVGGLGACTLISLRAIETGVSYDRLRNISYWGEDRHFCIRAAALGIPLYVDTHYPALHLYRDSDLAKVADYIRLTGAADGEADAPEEDAPEEDALEGAEADGADAALEGADVDGAAAALKGVEADGADAADGVWSAAEAQQRLRKAPLPQAEPAPGNAAGAGPRAGASADADGPAESDDGGGPGGAAGDAAAGTHSAAAGESASGIVPEAAEVGPAAGSLARGPKLTLTMVVKNEGRRFLRQMLEEHCKYIDEAVIIDDGSTDDTADICREVLRGIPLHLVRNEISKFSNEAELRKQQWEEVLKTNPEWILSLDADEVFEERFARDVELLLREDSCDLFCFRLYDFWDDSHYRDDMYWRSHHSYRPFLLRYREDFNYIWTDTPQHCGRLPENIFELPHQLSNLRLKHLGWSRPEYRLDKYLRYMLLDPEGQYGWKEQYLSILDQHPRLIPWTE